MASRMLWAGRPALAALAFALVAADGPAKAQGFFDIFAPPPMQSGAEANEPLMSPEQRRAVQRELGNRGFYRGPINASLNRETRHAIARWQASIRQNPSGYLTRGQLANLLTAPQPVAPLPDTPVAQDARPLPASPSPAPPAPVATAPQPAAVVPATALVLGDAYWSDQVPSLASTAGLTPEAFAARQATALHAVLTATGYEAWIRDHPGQATAGRLIAFLAPLWLGDAQIRRLFFELVDGKGTPVAPAVGAGTTLDERTTALVTAIEALGPQAMAQLQQRFDEQYRPLILVQAAKAPLRLTSVEALELGAFDAQAGGYRPAEGVSAGDGRIVDQGPQPGQGWPQIVLRTDGAARPTLVAMAERPASGPGARIYMARVLTAETVSLAFGGPRLEILVAGRQQSLTLHPDAALQQRLASAPTAGSMPATAAGAGPDVLGIRLGMELSDAQQVVAGHMPGHRLVEIAQKDPARLVLFGTARVLVAADNSEAIALVTQPERSGTRIVAIGRRLFGGPDAYDRDALIADLSAKYGSQPLRAGALLHWGGQAAAAETVCHAILGAVDLGPWTDAAGQAPRWQDYLPPEVATDFRGPGPMYWLGLRAPSPERVQEYAACQPTVAVYIPGAGPRASEFTLWLTDAKAYMGLLAAPTTPPQATARPKL